MTTKQLEKIKKIIAELEKDYDFNDFIMNYIDEDELKECEDASDVVKLIEQANEDYEITDTEVIYYTNAIEYLKQEDPSLSESIGIAEEFWFWLDGINSETLASLLATRRNEEYWCEFLENVEYEVNDLLGKK